MYTCTYCCKSLVAAIKVVCVQWGGRDKKYRKRRMPRAVHGPTREILKKTPNSTQPDPTQPDPTRGLEARSVKSPEILESGCAVFRLRPARKRPASITALVLDIERWSTAIPHNIRRRLVFILTSKRPLCFRAEWCAMPIHNKNYYGGP